MRSITSCAELLDVTRARGKTGIPHDREKVSMIVTRFAVNIGLVLHLRSIRAIIHVQGQ